MPSTAKDHESKLEVHKTARAKDLDTAIREIKAGKKKGCYIWYIMPQLIGLSSSTTSQIYDIKDVNEAIAFLKDPSFLTDYTAVIDAILSNTNRLFK